MAPSYSGVWNISTQYQYRTGWPIDANLGAVGIVAGGQIDTAVVNTIEKFLTAASSGNATDFGDLSVARHSSSSMGNDTRAIFAGGWDNYGGSSLSNVIDYITYATSGNAIDFGDVAATSSDANCSASNNVRGITFGGRIHSNSNIDNAIEYLTIATTGNMLDFGDLSVLDGAYTQRHRQGNGMSGSTTRGLASGGYTPNNLTNVIQYVTIASAGNSTDFGDMSSSTDELAHMSSNTRGVIAGGSGGGGAYINTIEYVTIASTGNVTDFGDMTVAKAFLMGASSSTKGFIIGGTTANGITNNINSIETIAFSTTGNATDFGDITTATRSGSANTSGHAAVQNEDGFAPAAIGLFAGGLTDSSIEYVNIATDGEGAMFGDLQEKTSESYGSGCSTTRACFFGGQGHVNSTITTVQFITFSTKGKATTFGNLSVNKKETAATSNVTRGLNAGGYNNQNGIEYITIASEGNATDFGDLTLGREKLGALSSTTRSVFTGGFRSAPENYLDYVTIASTGNATDFGDQTSSRRNAQGASSNTRGLLMGGDSSGGEVNTVGYITIASAGNATDFGDLSAVAKEGSAVSNKTLALYHLDADKTRLDKFTIASTGNATDWGDISKISFREFSGSNSHGGIA